MNLLGNHVLLMAIYACLTGSFFALISRAGRRERLKLFALVAGVLFFGGIAVAWFMLPFPLR